MVSLRTLSREMSFGFVRENSISQDHYRVVKIWGIYNPETLAKNTRFRQDRRNLQNKRNDNSNQWHDGYGKGSVIWDWVVNHSYVGSGIDREATGPTIILIRGEAMLKEFKDFAMRGNVVDMAVGIIIGGAFGKIVASFVGDVLMPPIGVLMGGVDFSSLAIKLTEAGPARRSGVAQVRQFLSDRGRFPDRGLCNFPYDKMDEFPKKERRREAG